MTTDTPTHRRPLTSSGNVALPDLRPSLARRAGYLAAEIALNVACFAVDLCELAFPLAFAGGLIVILYAVLR
jgi:hypothetical protein